MGTRDREMKYHFGCGGGNQTLDFRSLQKYPRLNEYREKHPPNTVISKYKICIFRPVYVFIFLDVAVAHKLLNDTPGDRRTC